MTSQYISSLNGDRLKDFEKCMHHEGKFKYSDVDVNAQTLKYFRLRGLIEIVGERPKEYVVPDNITAKFMERFPDFMR